VSSSPKQSRSKNIINRIVDYFARHPNQVVTVRMLSGSLRVSEGTIRNSINGFRHYHRKDPDHVSKQIETVIRGHSWRYVVSGLPVPEEVSDSESSVWLAGPMPVDRVVTYQSTGSSSEVSADTFTSKSAPIAASATAGLPTRHVFEEVGPVTGGFVIRDEDDVLYRATRL
jgi:hypothetical protein